MTGTLPVSTLPEGSTRVAVLTPVWSTATEAGWALRQVAGALAVGAEVHVITTQGTETGDRVDGVFVVHELATADGEAELRRDHLLEDLESRPSGAPDASTPVRPEAVRAVLDPSVDVPWNGAAACLASLSPALVVVADYRQLGAWRSATQAVPDTPKVLVPLACIPRRGVPEPFAAPLEHAGAVVCFSEGERELFSAVVEDRRAHVVGLPLAASVDARREPEPRVQSLPGYLLALTDCAVAASDRWMDYLMARFSDRPVVVVAPDALAVLPGRGEPQEHFAPPRESDLLRLMAWARVTVDLHPGILFGRRSLESLLQATPIVVPADSSAREHAEAGASGLWFDDLASLAASVETLSDPETSEAVGLQGQRYAASRFGSTASFLTRLAGAVETAMADRSVGISRELRELGSALPAPSR